MDGRRGAGEVVREKLARSRWESSVPPDADKEENETAPPHFFSFELERGDSSVLLEKKEVLSSFAPLFAPALALALAPAVSKRHRLPTEAQRF